MRLDRRDAATAVPRPDTAPDSAALTAEPARPGPTRASGGSVLRPPASGPPARLPPLVLAPVLAPRLQCPACGRVQRGHEVGWSAGLLTLWPTCDRAHAVGEPCGAVFWALRLADPGHGRGLTGADLAAAIGARAAWPALRRTFAHLAGFDDDALTVAPIPIVAAERRHDTDPAHRPAVDRRQGPTEPRHLWVLVATTGRVRHTHRDAPLAEALRALRVA